MSVGKNDETIGSRELAEKPSQNATAEIYKTADRNHLVELDCLRGIAIIAVVSHHMLTLWGARFGPVSAPLVGFNLLEILQALPGVPLFYLFISWRGLWTEGK
jgi:uncharacterized membrane protein